jgi:hypothetical protein
MSAPRDSIACATRERKYCWATNRFIKAISRNPIQPLADALAKI